MSATLVARGRSPALNLTFEAAALQVGMLEYDDMQRRINALCRRNTT